MNKVIYEIKTESSKLAEKTADELKLEIEKTKRQIISENLEKILPKWFALVQEVSLREIGLKHFDTQLMGGLFLNEGKIVEMKTGEGKTLVSTLPVSLNSLKKRGVHVVTVNDYLAERDQKWMGKVYNGLNLTSGLVKSTSTISEKQKSYNCDITYITNSELVFDYLRDSSAYNLNEIVQRPFDYCLIDEIDSVLIDEARTPLILSSYKESDNINKLYLAKRIANNLQKDYHFQVDEKRKDINLTENGYKESKNQLGKKTLYDPNDPWILDLLNALKARYLFKLNKDYIILRNKIVIVDEFTGRIMEDRRWSMGLHEAVEIKENVKVGGGTKTKSSITYQNFFTLYPKLAGMTGTGKTNEREFQEIYNLKVVVLPTVKPMVRKDLPDLVYQTELSKWKSVLEESKKCFESGQPLLIGTSTIEKSEFLSELFKVSKIPHQVLNAKPENVTRESEIVAQAGKRYSVTIATNMAGRGTDINLGGNPVFEVKQKISECLRNSSNVVNDVNKSSILEKDVNLWKEKIFEEYSNKEEKLEYDIQNLPYSLDECETNLRNFYQTLYGKSNEEWQKENKIVKDLGGLYVLGTERHETRRIDNQLRGRSGRQGDPGVSQFFVSLEDDLIKIFGGDSIKQWVEYLVDDKDAPLESDFLTKSLENAQKKVELYNYDLRKNVFQYDDILNSQRKQLFSARTAILSEKNPEKLLLRYHENSVDNELLKYSSQFINNSNFFENWKINKLVNFYIISPNVNLNEKIKDKKTLYNEIWIENDIRLSCSNFYQSGLLKSTRSIILLSIIDFYWTEHIERMGYIRETINWRAYGQQNPLIEYNIEAFKSFKLMFEQIRACMVYYFLKNPINF
jgi:preprotein translocase subunit SecA